MLNVSETYLSEDREGNTTDRVEPCVNVNVWDIVSNCIINDHLQFIKCYGFAIWRGEIDGGNV